MKFFYGLVLASYFFEGFIIQYSGASELENKRYFPDELIGEIIAKAGLHTTREMAKAQTKAAGHGIRRIFESHIIVIWGLSVDFQPEMEEVEEHGEMSLIIRSYTKLMSLFEQFGSHVRRINIAYESMNVEWRREINKNIINKYANQLTELLISVPVSSDDTGIWAEISKGKGDFSFPNLEKFYWFGPMGRKKFDLSAIIPRLKSLTLLDSAAHTNCLSNVKNLNELNVDIGSMQEDQLENIFRNNQKISRLFLTPEKPIKRETLRLIENLKKLKILSINKVDSEFFNRASDRVYNLTSVTQFKATFIFLIGSNENFSFDMPNVKDIQLYGYNINHRVCNFINQFKTLETVLLGGEHCYNIMECLAKLKYVKEFTLCNRNRIEVMPLYQFFENLHITKSNLRKIAFHVHPGEYTFYEGAMQAITNQLRRQNKPTWTFSPGISHFGVNFPLRKIILSLEMQA